ncbi:MAG: FAD-dependent oxidoreductase [Candidatus Moranbacteria bacterium]|nr:FAD-dependent oxidoreductase [Candidatus Moranbacteria bacterium]
MMQTYTIKLIGKQEIADQTVAFVFEKPQDFTFQAGQYVVMTLPKLAFPDNRRGIRSLSIASAPYEDTLMFAMRITDSGFKQTLNTMEIGDEATITKAIGHFVLDESERPVVFLIGGIGITPARSILRQAVRDGSKRRFCLFYSNRRPQDASFASELQEFPTLDYHCVDTLTNQDAADRCEWQEERGYICDHMLEKYLDDPKSPQYYVVGSPVFANAMIAMLTGMGVEKESIKQDPFTGI